MTPVRTIKPRKRREIPALPPLDQARRYPLNTAAAYLFISREKLYAKIKQKEITSILDGRRRFIPGAEIARLSRA